jgi:hypothetical protein
MGRTGPKQRQRLLKTCPKRELLEKYTKGPIYTKLVCCQVRGLHSIALMYAFDCDFCDRMHITATAQGWKWWKLGPARATAWDMGLHGVRSNLLLAFNRNCARSHQVRSSALAGTPLLLFKSILPLFSHVLMQRPAHHKRLKTTKNIRY